MQQYVRILIKDEYVEAYNYLREHHINCADIIRDYGQNGLYEKYRECKYNKRIRFEKQTSFD